jgi:ATP-dependent DNA helicase PIF1
MSYKTLPYLWPSTVLQVILAKNLDTMIGLVNGARGVVVGFLQPDDPRAAQTDKSHRPINIREMWPIVKFAGGMEKVMWPESWSIMEGDVEVAKRTQVPLLLAWALSVHKCQGMTLDRVETDLSRAFDYGMVYVALSRVKSLEGLQLIGFDPSKIKVHKKVAQFYDKLKSEQASLSVQDLT